MLLDGVRHMVLTTGTPPTPDRGAALLCDSAFAIRAAVDLPIQGQCEPPDDDRWFARLRAAGIDSLGMHLEAVTPSVRARIMPGKATVPLSRYLDAFAAAVGVFGRGRSAPTSLAGLGDTAESILSMSQRLLEIGVYPFVVPFVPISGTPLEDHPAPRRTSCAPCWRRWAAWWPRPGCARRTSRPAAASAGPAPRCRPTRGCGMRPELCVEVPAAPAYQVRWAEAGWEIEQAYALRRAVFCAEQGILPRTTVTRSMTPHSCWWRCAATRPLAAAPGARGPVVGTVRIHESEPGVWYGSRLAVQAPYRRHSRLGATLIRLAVSSAHALGCRRFLAHVQSQNVPLFRRLHWTTLAEETLLGWPHHLMEADLHHYPPCHAPYAGFVIDDGSAQHDRRPS